MKSFSTFVPFCALSLQLQPALAFWRMACSVSQTSRIDPILNPGTVSGHVHKFAGGNNIDQSSTHESLQSSTCSTCEVQSDNSAYWTPQLYYQHSDGTIEEVQNDGMTVYYVGRGGTSSNTLPFPDGFKMISGNSLLRHYDTQNLTYMDTRPIADRVSFRCINEANDIPETHYINDTNCVNGLRAQINFQSCWDGINLYKPGNTHVAYLSGIDYGVCPPTHPIPIPGLFYEVLYWSNRIAQTDGGRFVFSNGDTTGYGFHGDFLNGWDQAVQAQAVQDCLYNNGDSDGVVSACSALASSDNDNFSRICPESAEVMPEAIKGILLSNQLPGCNPITSGPSDATQVVCALNSTSPITGQNSSSSQLTAASTTTAASTLSVPSANSTSFKTTQSISTDSTVITEPTTTSLRSTTLSNPDTSPISTLSTLVTFSATDLTTAPTVVSTLVSIESQTTAALPTWTRSGHSWYSQSYPTFTRSYTDYYGGSQSDGGVFVTASSSSLSSDPASSAGDYTTVSIITTTVTVTLSRNLVGFSIIPNTQIEQDAVTLASSTFSDLGVSATNIATSPTSSSPESGDIPTITLLTVTTTETVTVDAALTVPTEASFVSIDMSPPFTSVSASTPLTVITADATITTLTVTESDVTTMLSSMPLSAHLSHVPIYSSWTNFSATWSNFSRPTGFSPMTPTWFGTPTMTLTSLSRTAQTTPAEATQSSVSVLNQTTVTIIGTTDLSSSSTTVTSSLTASVDASTVTATDSTGIAFSTPFYTGTVTDGMTTTLVTVFVPVSIGTTSATATATTDSTTTPEPTASALKKREERNQRLKALVTFRLRGREVIMERPQ